MFPDDTAGLVNTENFNTLVSFVNSGLELIARWFCVNKMAIGVERPNLYYSIQEEIHIIPTSR